MMFSKNKRKVEDATWRDYRSLIIIIVLWFILTYLILLFDPIRLYIAIPYATQVNFTLSTILVSLWMPLAFWYGRKKGFSWKWMLICIITTLVAMILLMFQNSIRFFPLECTYSYEPSGENTIIWIRTQVTCTRLFTLVT